MTRQQKSIFGRLTAWFGCVEPSDESFQVASALKIYSPHTGDEVALDSHGPYAHVVPVGKGALLRRRALICTCHLPALAGHNAQKIAGTKPTSTLVRYYIPFHHVASMNTRSQSRISEDAIFIYLEITRSTTTSPLRLPHRLYLPHLTPRR